MAKNSVKKNRSKRKNSAIVSVTGSKESLNVQDTELASVPEAAVEPVVSSEERSAPQVEVSENVAKRLPNELMGDEELLVESQEQVTERVAKDEEPLVEDEVRPEPISLSREQSVAIERVREEETTRENSEPEVVENREPERREAQDSTAIEISEEVSSAQNMTVIPLEEPLSQPLPSPEPVAEVSEELAQPSERRQIVKSATLVTLGNLGSSIMGMLRQSVVAGTGANISGPFLSALLPAQTFNDFLVNGSTAGALIPTFTDYATPERREELRRLVFTIVNLIILVMLGASVLFFFISPWFINNILVPGYSPENKLRTLEFSRIIFFSLMALGPFAVLLSALYALKEFGWPAFATASYHIGIIIGAIGGGLIGRHFFNEYGIALGVLIGAVGEIVLLLPGIRNQHLRYLFVLDLNHPALRRVLKLYTPVALSYLVSMGLVFFDQFLASRTPCASFMQGANSCGEANFTALKLATTLIQFPIGLVAAALSIAVLPTLSAHVRDGESERFKDTLLLGFRLGLLLMIPAAAGLIVLQTPIVKVLFMHHNYTQNNATLTAIALQNYAYQLPFVAMDQLLISAFYARKNTVIPVVVGFVSILGYLAVALPFSQSIGMPALAFANTVQNSSHAIILLVLLRMTIGHINVRNMIPTVLKILLATALMIGVAWGLLNVLGRFNLFASNSFIGQLLTLILVGGLAALTYFGGVLLLRVEEVNMLKGTVLSKLGRK